MDEAPSPPIEFIAPTLAELEPLFPAYELEGFIAQGGMGAVYKARQKSLDRSVAIKILPREFGDDPQFRASFEAEAKAMARLNHPNLISVYDFGDIEGMLYIIMEFVQGKALYYSAHNKAIDPPVALDLVSTISRGLGHAHRGGIIHRDIKPANILLDVDAKPKIGDFGLAHPLDRQKSEGVVFGTPGYTAPEIFHNHHPVDQRSDIFSVGALLYELLCGKHPEPNSTSMTSGIDPRIDAIIKKATHPDPNNRYHDVDALADDIDALIPKLSGPRFATTLAPAGAALPLTPPNTTLASSQKKSSLAPVLFVLALIIGAGAAAFFALNKKEKVEPVVEEPANNADSNKEKARNPKKDRPKKPRPPKDKMAGKQEPKTPAPKPDKPVVVETKESPLQSLARLKTDLAAGGREEFPISTVKREKAAYFLTTRKLTWFEASQLAREHGAHLANLPITADLQWFHDHFKSDTPVWLGASDSGFEKKWYWTDGSTVDQSLWSPKSPDNSESANPNGEDFAAISQSQPAIEDFDRQQKFPALLEWRLDGSRPSSLDAQLARTGDALNNKRTPIFPAGTFNVGGSRFLLVNRSVDWQEASVIATNAGGHLAVPSNEKEASFMALLLREVLVPNSSCWIGGKRDDSIPEIWNYITGETFTHITWMEGQPDNTNESENFLVLIRDGEGIKANDESLQGHRTDQFLIEWSVPALRNMPRESADTIGENGLLAALEAVRNRIRDRHGRAYRKFRREHDKIVEDFVKDTITYINNQDQLSSTIKDRLVEEIKQYLDKNELPESLPAGAQRRLKDKLTDAKAEMKMVKEDYKEDFEEAKQAYLKAVLGAGNDALNAGENVKGKMFVLENTVTKDNNERFNQIMDNQKVPLPVEPKKPEEEKEGEE